MGTSQWPRSKVEGVRVEVAGLKNWARGSMRAIWGREYVRWVLKGLLEGLGRGGWISWGWGGLFGGGLAEEEEEEEGATVGCCASTAAAGFLYGEEEEEGRFEGAPFVLGGKEKGEVAGGRVSSGGSADGGEEETWSRGRFAGGEACPVGEGELEVKGRLR